jgi:hypothetical protein
MTTKKVAGILAEFVPKLVLFRVLSLKFGVPPRWIWLQDVSFDCFYFK